MIEDSALSVRLNSEVVSTTGERFFPYGSIDIGLPVAFAYVPSGNSIAQSVNDRTTTTLSEWNVREKLSEINFDKRLSERTCGDYENFYVQWEQTVLRFRRANHQRETFRRHRRNNIYNANALEILPRIARGAGGNETLQ